jgi:hypothetical protein
MQRHDARLGYKPVVRVVRGPGCCGWILGPVRIGTNNSFPEGARRLVRRSTRRTNTLLTGRRLWTIAAAVFGAVFGAAAGALANWGAAVIGAVLGPLLLGVVLFGVDLLRYVRSGYQAEGWTPMHSGGVADLSVQINKDNGPDMDLDEATCVIRAPDRSVRELEDGHIYQRVTGSQLPLPHPSRLRKKRTCRGS